MNYNVIQWLDFDEAEYAYADMQSDPRTGEILEKKTVTGRLLMPIKKPFFILTT